MSHSALFIPTLNKLNTDLVLTINNFDRPHYEISKEAVNYKIKLFSAQGELIKERMENVLEPQGLIELKANDFANLNADEEYLFCVDFNFKNLPNASLIREHQIVYKNKTSEKFGIVIFENLPQLKKAPATIVCIAHKCFVTESINTILCLGIRGTDNAEFDSKEAILEYSLLDESGQVRCTKKLNPKINSPFYINVKEHEKEFVIPPKNGTRFYTLCLKLQNARSIIYTAIHNEKSGNLAIEHSLAPIYYTDIKDLASLRKTALSNLF